MTCIREEEEEVTNALQEIVSFFTVIQWQLIVCLECLRMGLNAEFMEDFSVLLLSKLLQTSIKLCSDNDKSRYNAVRAVGNLLRYLPQQALGICSIV